MYFTFSCRNEITSSSVISFFKDATGSVLIYIDPLVSWCIVLFLLLWILLLIFPFDPYYAKSVLDFKLVFSIFTS